MIRSILIVMIGLLSAVLSRAGGGDDSICRYAHGARNAAPLGIDLEGNRQYAPDRQVDVLHLKVDVVPDFQQRTIAATTSITASPLVEPLEVLHLDTIDLNVSDVTCDEVPVADFTAARRGVQIAFAQPIAPGKTFTVHIAYTAQPSAGLYFRTPEMGYAATDTHLWTQGESHEARHWIPCFDYPNERSSTEIICHVPNDMIVISNGRRMGETTDAQGLKVVRWLQEKPHVTYLMCLVAGYFDKLESRHRDIPLAFYSQPSLSKYAANSFRDTPDIMDFFEKEIGVPYPWAKYDQVTIVDFVAGGMENTTLTTLTHNTIFSEATENIRTTRRLAAHELVHQWFGDYVTCKDWSHLWLNEGFATYYTHLYEGHRFGRDAMLYGLYRDATNRILTQKNDKRPIVYRGYKNAGEQFDYRAYPKASWVLHMLRSQLGPEPFRQCIKTYLEEHALDSVVSEDLRRVIEQHTGRSMDRFFDQWLYHGRFPDLKVSYQWLAKQRMAKVTVQQTQPVDDDVLLFQFPCKLRFVVAGKVIDHDIEVQDQQHEFYIPLPGRPSIVRFDPELTVLANVEFDKPNDLLKAQIENPDDMMGRLLACNALGSRKTHESRTLLASRLNKDPFYGVRIAAADALAKHDTDEAYDVLAASWPKQTDARVRLAVVEKIARRVSDETARRIRDVLESERNPAIQAVAIRALGRFHGTWSRERILAFLRSQSFRNELAVAAISAIRQQNDSAYATPLVEVLRSRERAFSSRDFGQGLETLGYAASLLDDKDPIREFLAGYLDHPKSIVRRSALTGLGALGDPRAIPLVEVLVDSSDQRVASAAQRALDKLRDVEPLVPRELVELRQEMSKLRKEDEKLRDELKALREQLEALRSDR